MDLDWRWRVAEAPVRSHCLDVVLTPPFPPTVLTRPAAVSRREEREEREEAAVQTSSGLGARVRSAGARAPCSAAVRTE